MKVSLRTVKKIIREELQLFLESDDTSQYPWNNWPERKVVTHHITLNMGPPKSELIDKVNAGEVLTLESDGYAVNDRILALSIPKQQLTDMGVPCKNENPHVTVALASPQVKPMESNELLKTSQKMNDIRVPPIKGKISFVQTDKGSYTAIVLDDISRQKVLQAFGIVEGMIPGGDNH
jgi:hypothetical protein